MVTPYPEVRRVDPEEVKRRLDAGDPLLIVDVRSPEAFAASHIPGARSLPAKAIGELGQTLPHDREIVLY